MLRQLRAAGDDPRPRRGRHADRRICPRAAALPADPGDARRVVKAAFLSAEDKNFYKHPRRRLRGHRPRRRRPTSRTAAQATPRAPRPSPSRWPRTSCSPTSRPTTARSRRRCSRSASSRPTPRTRSSSSTSTRSSSASAPTASPAAALNYFGKSVHELTIAEAAYLAALPKGAEQLPPVPPAPRPRSSAATGCIDRMVENGYVTARGGRGGQAEAARRQRRASAGTHTVRRRIFRRGGAPRDLRALRREEALRGRAVGPHHARSEDAGDGPQGAASTAWCATTRRAAGAAPVATIDDRRRLGRSRSPRCRRSPTCRPGAWRWCSSSGEHGPHRPAAAARLRPAPSRERETGAIDADDMSWAMRHGPRRKREVAGRRAQPGDVVYVEPIEDKPRPVTACARCRRSRARMVAMDPHTGPRARHGRRLLLSTRSEFNRATQALRQPGSSFKPFVYAAALDNGYTPASVVLDAPITIDQGRRPGSGRRRTTTASSAGPSTLRYGIEQSRNLMTVRLAKDIGMPLDRRICRALRRLRRHAAGARRWRSAPARPRCCAWSSAYSMLANGGQQIKPTLIDRIQDRYGKTIYRHDERDCDGCDADELERPGRAGADRQSRAGARPDDRLPDHLDAGRRGPARHGGTVVRARQADRRQDRHHQRREGRLVHRLHARTSSSASTSATTSRARSATARPAAVSPRRSSSDFMQVALKDKPTVDVPRAARASS